MPPPARWRGVAAASATLTALVTTLVLLSTGLLAAPADAADGSGYPLRATPVGFRCPVRTVERVVKPEATAPACDAPALRTELAGVRAELGAARAELAQARARLSTAEAALASPRPACPPPTAAGTPMAACPSCAACPSQPPVPSRPPAPSPLPCVPHGAGLQAVYAPFQRLLDGPLVNRTNSSGAANSSSPLFVLVPDVSYWRGYVSAEFHQLFHSLRAAYGWQMLDEYPDSWAGLRDVIVARWGRPADVVMLCPGYESTRWTRLAGLGPLPAWWTATAVWTFVDDLHVHAHEGQVVRDAHRALIGVGHSVVSFYAYDDAWSRLWPELAHMPTIWLPHSAGPDFMLPANPAPTAQVLLIGAVDEWYPLREEVDRRINAGDTRFVRVRHAGYGYNGPGAGAFAREMHGRLAVFTCTSKVHYIVAKVFEIPAVGSLLLVNDDLAPELALLGFVPGVNYVAYNKSSIDRVADWVLQPANRGAVDRIRLAGQALAWTRHLVTHRAAAAHQAALGSAAAPRPLVKPTPRPST